MILFNLTCFSYNRYVRFPIYTDLPTLIITTYRESFKGAIFNRKTYKLIYILSILRYAKYVDKTLLLRFKKNNCKNIIFERDWGINNWSIFWHRLFSKRANWQNCGSISDCSTRQYESYGIHNKNALFAQKQQVSFDPIFCFKRSTNFCIFMWSAKTIR